MVHSCFSRRNFIKRTSLAGAGVAAAYHLPAFPDNLFTSDNLSISVFSKHLQFLNLSEMAQNAAEIGFDGVDLSVRPNGHVIPEEAEQKLPVAIDSMKRAGLSPLLMTSSVSDADNATDRTVLEVASSLGIRYYRMNYYRYLDGKSIPDSVNFYQDKIRSLSELNAKLNITGCYQNHAGNYMGASMWELYLLLSKVENQFFGIQYDIRHAVVEGGMSWQNGLKLVKPRISTLALKDFRWEKTGGQWRVANCPIGEGMVDFTAFFKMIKEFKLNVPFSLHFEYPLGGAENGSNTLSIDKKEVFSAMRRDLGKIRHLWREA